MAKSSGEGIVRRLAKIGYDAREIEALVRSKHTRWSRDAAGGYRGKARDFMDYYASNARRGFPWPAEVKMLVDGTFGSFVSNRE